VSGRRVATWVQRYDWIRQVNGMQMVQAGGSDVPAGWSALHRCLETLAVSLQTVRLLATTTTIVFGAQLRMTAVRARMGQG